LHARGALPPTAITTIAFLAANYGALEIVGLVAASARYGALTLHFYWVGAIPAIVFSALFMMQIYARSGAMTVQDFLRIRYNDATQILSALSLAIMMAFISGISLYAISSVLHRFFSSTTPRSDANVNTCLRRSTITFSFQPLKRWPHAGSSVVPLAMGEADRI